MARKKLTDYEKEIKKIRDRIQAHRKKRDELDKSIESDSALLRKMNLDHNAPVIRSMSEILLDASDSVDLAALMEQTDFKSAFEAFLRNEQAKKDLNMKNGSSRVGNSNGKMKSEAEMSHDSSEIPAKEGDNVDDDSVNKTDDTVDSFGNLSKEESINSPISSDNMSGESSQADNPVKDSSNKEDENFRWNPPAVWKNES